VWFLSRLQFVYFFVNVLLFPECPDIRVGSRLFHSPDLMYVLSLEGGLAGSVFVCPVQMAKLLAEVLVDH
jgi:hypothetical protein